MAHVIRVRDVAHEALYEFGPEQPILRGPYDLFQFPSVGAIRRHGAMVDWLVPGGEVRTGRVSPASMGEVRPGERVLVQLPPGATGDDWWLCEIEAVDGIAVAQ
jgi:hypothetical protein